MTLYGRNIPTWELVLLNEVCCWGTDALAKLPQRSLAGAADDAFHPDCTPQAATPEFPTMLVVVAGVGATEKFPKPPPPEGAAWGAFENNDIMSFFLLRAISGDVFPPAMFVDPLGGA